MTVRSGFTKMDQPVNSLNPVIIGTRFAFSLSMNADQFHQLAYHQQTEVLLTGTFLADRVTEKYYVRLYNVDNFYLEAFFDHRSQLIIHYRAFTHTLFVLPYLDEVNIEV